MDKNLYKQTIDSIRISDKAVETAINNLKKPDAVGKVIEMRKKHRYIKPIGAVAAALALVIGAGAIFNFTHSPANGVGNSFFITVNAAATDDEANAAATDDEVEELSNEFKPIGYLTDKGDGYKYDDSGVDWAELTMLTDISCEGTNVDEITYKVSGDGKISSYGRLGKFIKVKGEEDNFNGFSSEINGIKEVFYDSVTTTYENQISCDDEVCFNVAHTVTPKEAPVFKIITDREMYDSWYPVSVISKQDLIKAMNKVYNTILKDNIIIVTAKYKDGTTETKKLALKASCDAYTFRDSTENIDRYDIRATISAKIVE